MAITKLHVQDKEGIRFIEIDPSKKYILVVNEANAEAAVSMVQDKVFAKKLTSLIGTQFVLIVEDINGLKLEEKEHFLDVLTRKENHEG